MIKKLNDSVRKSGLVAAVQETLCNQVSLCMLNKGGEENVGCERKEIRQVLKEMQIAIVRS